MAASQPERRDWDSDDGHQGGDHWWGPHWRDPQSTDAPSPTPTITTTTTATTPSPSSPSGGAGGMPSLSSTISLPGTTFSSIIYSQNGMDDHDHDAASGQRPWSHSSSSIPLIMGVILGIFITLVGTLALWWLLRRRRRQLDVQQSQSKTILMSPQDTPQPSQLMDDLERQSEGQHRPSQGDLDDASASTATTTAAAGAGLPSEKPRYPSSNKSFSSITPSKLSKQTAAASNTLAVKCSLMSRFSSIGSHSPSPTSLPMQLPTFPTPTPRDQIADNFSNAISAVSNEIGQKQPVTNHRFPRKNVSGPITLPSRAPAAYALHNVSTPSLSLIPHEEPVGSGKDQGGPANDFYIDMLDLLLDTELSPTAASSMAKKRSATPSPSTPLPHSRANSRPNSRPTSSAPQTPTRPRSPSGGSVRNFHSGGNASPRVSKEARRMIQNFLPPPPPPSVPPPAIPTESSSSDAQGSKQPRQRASTMSAAITKPTSSLYQWYSAPLVPPSPSQNVSVPRPSCDTVRGKRAGMILSGASVKNMAIQPPTSPPPAAASLHGHQQSPASREPFHRHQRTQSNVLSSSDLTVTLDQFFPELPLPPSLAQTIAGNSSTPTRPPLRHHHTHQGTIPKVNDRSLAVTSTKPKRSSADDGAPVRARKSSVEGTQLSNAVANAETEAENGFESSNSLQTASTSLTSSTLDLDSKIVQTIQAWRAVGDNNHNEQPASP